MEISEFKNQIAEEWRDNIAPFWLRYAPDEKHGGFHGWITNDLKIDKQAEKGIILNARILWTFAHAYKLYQNAEFLSLANRAFNYLTEHFIDREYGGVFWTLDYRGQPLDTKKRPYAQAFALYGLTELYLATGEVKALAEARALFDLLESRARDAANDGYFETFERDWTLADDQRLSDVDQDEKKSMNTHLHVLEAYATLARATNDAGVKDRLRAVITLFLEHIIHPEKFYLKMFFNEIWTSKSDHLSFGHDIEGSWLLCEAAEVLADAELLAQVRNISVKMAQSLYNRGLDGDGSLLYEADAGGIIDDDKHWWTQTEAVVGFVNAYQLSGHEYFLAAALRVWEFISRYLVDKQNGEWFWKTSRAGVPALEMPKLSQWKCPYHNGRMCFEISRRLA
ncbi:MAG: AGE family epimerase/isomerase [Pyrinomonadaceae bacterium]|nr:AGE family epimerase/isomerase [Pyrinomonadaceae bacterium]